LIVTQVSHIGILSLFRSTPVFEYKKYVCEAILLISSFIFRDNSKDVLVWLVQLAGIRFVIDGAVVSISKDNSD